MKQYLCDYVILGAGLSGISLATQLKQTDDIVVLEKSETPGGLVKSVHVDGFWFDAVLHLLHFHNPEVEKSLKALLGKTFKPLIPKADVRTAFGTTKFPFQLNLGGLPKEVAIECIAQYIEKAYTKPPKIKDFEEWLLHSFGDKMCEVFFFPYNNKMWKRPLSSLGTRDFVWNIQNYNISKVLSGLLPDETKVESYNSNSWYPVPRKGSKKRCMGLLIDKLVEPVKQQIKLGEEVVEVDTKRRQVITESSAGRSVYQYKKACISTIPLPVLQNISLPKIAKKIELKTNGVLYAMIMLKGQKYDTANLWDYFSDEAVVFSRIIYMQNFDPHTAPENKWSIMAEITYKSEAKKLNLKKMEQKIKQNLLELNIVNKEKDFIKIHFVDHEYAYAVFEKNTSKAVRQLSEKYLKKDVHLLGRYGKWQYLSMAQVYEEAMKKAEELNS